MGADDRPDEASKIHVRVGSTGALNPWARLEPVEVGGVTVSQATLHNEEDINRKDIREGDTVIVQRAGDVIPQVVGPVLPHAKGTKRFRMPKKCPLCGTEIVKPEGEVMHRCPNNDCPSRGLEPLNNWVMAPPTSRASASSSSGASGSGPSVHPDLYRITKEQLAELDGYADISAQNAVDAIAASKDIAFSRVLAGLNIPDVGWVTAQNLARHFGSIDALLAAPQEEIEEVDGIGLTAPSRSPPGSPTTRTGRSWRICAARGPLGAERRRAARRGRAQRLDLRDHGHARPLVARAGKAA